jgi:hypothetical protein
MFELRQHPTRRHPPKPVPVPQSFFQLTNSATRRTPTSSYRSRPIRYPWRGRGSYQLELRELKLSAKSGRRLRQSSELKHQFQQLLPQSSRRACQRVLYRANHYRRLMRLNQRICLPKSTKASLKGPSKLFLLLAASFQDMIDANLFPLAVGFLQVHCNNHEQNG